MAEVEPVNEHQAVWHRTVDGGEWIAQVQRERGGGRLLVWHHPDTAHPILDQHVGLAYGAMFGPDVDDVLTWEHAVIEAIDAQVDHG
jgi:hypothetical protein